MANKEIFLNSGSHKVDLPKGTFDKSFRNHLTAKLGYLYPCLVEEAVAGSTYKIKPDMVFDLMPMAMPLQSRMRAHVSFFNVPFRILMKSYKDYFSRVGDHVMPYISRDDDWVTPGSLADYMGVPTAQFSESSAFSNVDFLLRGFFNSSDFNFSSLSSTSHLQNTSLYTFNQIISTTSSPVHPSILTSKLQSPLASSFINFSIFTGSSPASIPSVYVYALIGKPGSGYTINRLYGSTSGVFVRSTTSPQPEGTYKTSLLGSTYTVGNFSFRSYDLTFNIAESDLSALNSYLSSDDFDVHFLFEFTSTACVGTSYGSIFPDEDSAINTIRTLSSFDKDDSGIIPVLSLVGSSCVLQGFHYSALVGFIERTRKYFNVVDGEPPQLPINALSFRAYEFIYNKYFRNLQVDKFYKNGEVSFNEYITNDGDGADSTTPVELKRVPYEYDVFTTALPSPQMGYAPLVGVTTNNDSGTGILHMIPLVDGQPDPTQAYDIAVSYNSENGDVMAISNYDEVANHTSVARLQEAIDFGISINDLRNVSAFQRLKEKMLKAGYEYQPLMEEFYGTTPPIGEEFPEYLGGFTREIQIGKIQNTALTAEHPLGEFAGVGGVAGASRPIKVYTKEPSYIIGVLWFSVTPTYSQMLPKHFLKFHPLDYFNPTFNAIGPQPIHTHEIAPLQLSSEDLNKVFGYQRPWYDYVSRVDECHGEFRTSMRHYLLQRLFAVAPELTANFINIHSEELTDIFTYTVDSDKFFGYIDFDIKCKSPVARVSVPRIIG